jgi:hypothetical protein
MSTDDIHAVTLSQIYRNGLQEQRSAELPEPASHDAT